MKEKIGQRAVASLVNASVVVLIGIFLPCTSFGVCFQPEPTVRCEFLNSDAVFIGTVISTRDEPARGRVDNDGWIYTLMVERRFRGASSKTIEVYTENASARFPLDNGKRYLLFAFRSQGRLQIIGCGNSALIASAQSSIRTLETLKIPTDAVIEGRISFSGIPDTGVHTSGIVIIVRGDGGTFKAVSDSDGWFHLNVPPGKYSAKPQSIHGMTVTPYDLSYNNPDHFVARRGHCSGLQFRADSD
jgi:hypothetical protein